MPKQLTLSRRRLLGLLGGAAVAAALVGCGAAGDSKPSEPTEGTRTPSSKSEGAHGAAPAKEGGGPAAPAAAGHGGASLFGPTYLIKDRIVNLADPTARRYLRVSVAIEFAPHETAQAAAPRGQDAASWQRIAYAPERDGDRPVNGGGKSDPEKQFQAQVKRYVPAIEDAVLTLLSSKTYVEVAPPERREATKQEIKARLVALLEGTDLHVTNVYFTDFVVQSG
jgi:flagellar basal body-associated protein FliL